MEIKNRKKRKREILAQRKSLLSVKIAILCGSSIGELTEYLELFLLEKGIQPTFFIGSYNRYYEDALYNSDLLAFSPDIIYFHTTNCNINVLPETSDSAEKIFEKLEIEADRFYRMWDSCYALHSCLIIQNNFEPPFEKAFGNLEFSDMRGRVSFINALNSKISEYARGNKSFLVQDIAWLAAKEGLSNWHDPKYMCLYKYAVSYKCIPVLARSLASITASAFGKRKKCIVLDLDNTLWGGVVGDDGVSGIAAGSDSPSGEAFLAFQKYLKRLSETGVLLAVASKNEEETARSGFKAQGMLLREEDFASFHANWEPKHENILRIARELNLGLDSFVFVDDNPAERELISKFLPEVSIINGGEPLEFIRLIDESGFFEASSIVEDDVKRVGMYKENHSRLVASREFENYEEYLRSLSMKCLFAPLRAGDVERATALINKTNQFNITAFKISENEALRILDDPKHIAISGRLSDKFGDNGLVTVFVGKIEGGVLFITAWVMSCRVFSRSLEYALFDEVVRICCEKKVKRLIGSYKPTNKNRPVEKLYETLGFNLLSTEGLETKWEYEIPSEYRNKTNVIEIFREDNYDSI